MSLGQILVFVWKFNVQTSNQFFPGSIKLTTELRFSYTYIRTRTHAHAHVHTHSLYLSLSFSLSLSPALDCELPLSLSLAWSQCEHKNGIKWAWRHPIVPTTRVFVQKLMNTYQKNPASLSHFAGNIMPSRVNLDLKHLYPRYQRLCEIWKTETVQ